MKEGKETERGGKGERRNRKIEIERQTLEDEDKSGGRWSSHNHT